MTGAITDAPGRLSLGGAVGRERSLSSFISLLHVHQCSAVRQIPRKVPCFHLRKRGKKRQSHQRVSSFSFLGDDVAVPSPPRSSLSRSTLWNETQENEDENESHAASVTHSTRQFFLLLSSCSMTGPLKGT